jgi:metal-responsive CopG/Arc/MetJ family transcriptional regulator
MDQFVTTVKLNQELYNQFKEINIRGKISFQDFVNKCLEKYLTDTDFQTEISESVCTKLSHNAPFSLSSGGFNK